MSHTIKYIFYRLEGVFKKRNLHKAALSIAKEKGMEYDYILARKHGLSPIEALEEFDLLDDEAKGILTCAMAHSKVSKVHAS